ncbi:MAG: NADH-quinone oxidoreductase subunit M [Acidobacteriota bacterium]|nr:NADH-quinone oxidoreductase subunit M [Acidobacteriota bacterium]
MSLPFDPLFAAIAVPLALALAIGLGLPKRWSVRLAYAGFAVPLVMALHVWYHFAAEAKDHGFAFVSRYDTGLTGLGIALKLGVNGVSMPLFAMAGIVGFAAGWYAIHAPAEKLKIYLMLLLIMQAGLMGIFCSVDVFFIYFFHELAVIPTFIMIGLWGGRDRVYAAMKLTIYLTLGAMLSLFGLIAIYARSGAHSFDLMTLHDVLARSPLPLLKQKHFFGCLLFGFGILVSLWPFHTWAPLAYGAAPSSNAMLHAGVLKKFGLYGLVQIALPLLPDAVAPWAQTLALLAAFGNVLVIGLVTIAQRDVKQMVGYSSVMHMGYAFLGIACGSALGVSGVVLLMVAHGLSVALLFMLVTAVHHRTQTFALDEMGGLAAKAPVLAAFFAAAVFASIGLPGFANFWGELAIFTALWQYSPFFTAIALLGVILSAVYGLRAAARIFYGSPTVTAQETALQHPVIDLTPSERVPALVLLAALLFIGFYPASVTHAIAAVFAR